MKPTADRLLHRWLVALVYLLAVFGIVASGGGGDASGRCPPPIQIAADSVTNGSLTSSDCTLGDLFASQTGDQSLIDQYLVTLPQSGEFSIQLDSAEFDTFLVLTDSSVADPPIAFDDNGGGGTNSSLTLNLPIGDYIIVANSFSLGPVTGAYTLTTSFAPDVWTATSTTGAPAARSDHTAVWTGSRMIVWGGQDGNSIAKNNGGRFDPVSDSWQPTSLTGAPSPRYEHTAVWTGNEMIIWGGFSGASSFVTLGNGGRYFPGSNTWGTVSSVNQPSARANHTAVWTGTEMIVWGGFSALASANAELGTGARYNPATNTWTPMSTVNAPEPRGNHTAVWTGTRMIVWGGQTDQGTGSLILLNSGGAYDPVTNSWTTLSVVSAPPPKRCHSAVWTGTEMIIFGGQTNAGLACYLSTDNKGARYKPTTNSWSSMTNAPVASSMSSVRSLWSGDRLITWFENVGARYDPVGNSWRGISTGSAPSIRNRHTLVWTGSAMIVWGGDFAGPQGTGGIYYPQFDTTP